MPLFRFREQKRNAGKLTGFLDSDAASLAKSLPEITHHLVSLAQKAAIQLYRKIHSHETGRFLSVRDEFLFLLCCVFRQGLDSRHSKDDAARLWRAFQKQLNETLVDLQQDFDIAAFWEREAHRAAGYDLCVPPEGHRGMALSGTPVVSFFAECQTLHLGPDLAAKIVHFSEQVLKELEREI